MPANDPNMLDSVADDLSHWIDDMAEQVASAFAPGRAPFAAPITQEQKLEYYRAQLFNPDGSPNPAGRQAQLQRLGTDGFTRVYKAVIRAWPDLQLPTPPEIAVPQQWPRAPQAPPGGPPAPPGVPPGLPVGAPPGAAAPAPPGGGPRMPVPPRPVMMPPAGAPPRR